MWYQMEQGCAKRQKMKLYHVATQIDAALRATNARFVSTSAVRKKWTYLDSNKLFCDPLDEEHPLQQLVDSEQMD